MKGTLPGVLGLLLLMNGCAGRHAATPSIREEALRSGKIEVGTIDHPEPALRDVVLAVLPFAVEPGMVPDGRFLAESIAVRAARNPRVKVVERVRIDEILKELSLGDIGPIREETAVRIGNLLGANLLLLGSAAQVGDTKLLTMRLVKVETGEVIGGISDRNSGDLSALVESTYGRLDELIAVGPKAHHH